MAARWTLWLVAGVALLLVLVATAPARLLMQLVPAEQMVLQGVSGTVWQGRATRALVAVSGDDWLHLGELHWTLHPSSLLTFSPAVTIDSGWGRQQVRGRVTLHSQRHISLNALDATLDAGLLRQFLPVMLTGSVALQFDQMTVVDGVPAQAEGRLVWQNTGWMSPQGPRPLGTYAMDVSSAQDGVLSAEVITLAGDVIAEGPVELRDRAYRVDVLLTGDGLAAPQLRQAVQLLASPEGDGYRVQLQGSL